MRYGLGFALNHRASELQKLVTTGYGPKTA
jgi:hypothetical protein